MASGNIDVDVKLEVVRIEVIEMHPGDTYLFETDRMLPPAMHERVREQWARMFPGTKALVLDTLRLTRVLRAAGFFNHGGGI